MLFNRELALVNKELSKKLPFLPAHMCHYVGLAHWLRALRRRIDRPLKVSIPHPWQDPVPASISPCLMPPCQGPFLSLSNGTELSLGAC